MSVERSVSGSSSQVLALSEWDVLVLRVLIALGQTKVDNVDVVLGGFSGSNQEVVWLNIPMDNSLLMHLLNSLNHLVSDVQHSLQVKFTPALLEEIFEGFTEQVHDHDVVHLAVVSLLITNEVQEWHKGLASHLVDELGLPKEHNVSLHFNCFFNFSSQKLASLFLFDLVDLSESTATEFLNYPIAAI